MKIRLLFTLAWLAIGFAAPGLAQEQSTVTPEVRQQIEAVVTKYDEAYKQDAAALADLYTQNAVQVLGWESGSGAVSGQQAIEKRYASELATGLTDHVSELLQLYPVGDEICAILKYSAAQWKGYNTRIYVRDADTWKIQLEYSISSMAP
jgi:ketosteroid isomerase-like protein